MNIFTLPFPPSINHYYLRRGKRTFISHKGRAYRLKVSKVLERRRCAALSGPLEVRIDLYPPDRRKRDLDNYLKAVIDALACIRAFRDDSQIVRLVARKLEPCKDGDGKVEVRIRELGH